MLWEQKEAQPTRTKKEEQRDRSHETDQSDHLEKEEEADPDLEFMSETGHVHAEGPMHHVHGHKAKNPKAKTKIRKAKAKGKIPRTKMGKVKCKSRGTSKTFQTKLWNGTENFAIMARAKIGQNVVGNMKFSNAFDWSTTTQTGQEATFAKVHSDIWTRSTSGRIPPST